MDISEFIQTNWVQICIAYLVIKNVVTGVREAIDSTPETDDTPFEKFCTFVASFSGYFILGKRSK